MAVTTSRVINIVPPTAIAAAVTAFLTEEIALPIGIRSLALQAAFLYGAGGTTVKAWLQTSFDGGETWCDIVNFAFTTAALRKVTAVSADIAAAAPATPTDGTLADNTKNDGLLGDRVRVKLTTTGTYSGSTSLAITAVPR